MENLNKVTLAQLCNAEQCLNFAKDYMENYYKMFSEKREEVHLLYKPFGAFYYNGISVLGRDSIRNALACIPPVTHVMEEYMVEPKHPDSSNLVVTAEGKANFVEFSMCHFKHTVVLAYENAEWLIVNDNYQECL